MAANIKYVEHYVRLVNLRALEHQGYDQRGNFSKCIEQCERSLREHAGMAPYWRIKTYCILVGAYQHDWEEAEVPKHLRIDGSK